MQACVKAGGLIGLSSSQIEKMRNGSDDLVIHNALKFL